MPRSHFLNEVFDPQRVMLLVDDEGARPLWVCRLVEAAPLASRPIDVIAFAAAMPVPQMPAAGGGGLLVVIALPFALVAAAIELAADWGAVAVAVLTRASDQLQADDWLARSRARGLRLLGPGSLGFLRPHLGLNLAAMGSLPKVGELAIVTQSGALGASMLDWASDSGTGFSLVVSVGTEADIDLAEVLDFLTYDQRTRAVILYIESICGARPFMSALRALAATKPVIALKAGRADLGRRAALTHSSAIGASHAVYEAALRRAGAVQIRIFAQLEITARYLGTRSAAVGSRLAVIGNGHGPTTLAADHALVSRLGLPGWSQASLQLLADRWPQASPANPLVLLDADPAQFADTLEQLARDEGVDALLAIVTPHRCADVLAIAQALVGAAGRISKPVFTCFMGGRQAHEAIRHAQAGGLVAFETPEAAVNAYANVAEFHRNQLLALQTPRPLSELDPPDLAEARSLVAMALADGRGLLDEVASKALLEAFHLPVVSTAPARDADQAVAIARRVGYPVAIKVLSRDLSHKSDVGGVALNLRHDADVREQFDAIIRSVGAALPQAHIDGVSVQAMHAAPFGRELYIGVFRDPVWGPVMAFGAGGTRIEVMRDTTLEFAPLNRFIARQMIGRTRVSQTLGAMRGMPAVDMDALERVLLRVSEIVCELPQVIEMDINPVIVDAHGAMVVDARIVLGEPAPQTGPYSHMAIHPYPSYLERHYTMKSGQSYTVRPVQPEDADGLQTFMRSLSQQTRYFRFISTLSELPPRMLVRFTQIDYDREVAMLAISDYPGKDEPAGQRIIGVVRYMLGPDKTSCEFAVVVHDRYQGQGLGARLMNSLIEIARARGLQRIEGYVLASNRHMLGLMRHLGFSVVSEPDDPEMCMVTLTLRAPQPA